MFMLIREGQGGGDRSAVVNTASERSAKQVQAAIKKIVEKQKKQTETGMSEPPNNSLKTNGEWKQTVSSSSERREGDEENAEDAVTKTEQQQVKDKADLLPMVHSVFGQDRDLRPEEIEDLREAFKEFDNNKGYIKCRDLGECMRTMGYMPTEMELIELSQQIGGGKIDFEDFVELMGPKMLAETADMIGMKELKNAFKEFDSNGDGQISISELREAMKKLMGEQLNQRDFDEIIQDVDLNGDGEVDFEEFVRMMSR